jgi:hypothetical protein
VSLTAPERETVITMTDADGVAEIYTAQRPIITKLKKNPAATLLEEGKFEGPAWARFELPKALISFRSGQVKRPGAAAHLRSKTPIGKDESQRGEAKAA